MTMTRRNSDNELAFCVVQFTELPFEGIDDYVCVPHTWLTAREPTDQTRATVAYPEDENPFDTRDRAERKERYNDEWKRYMTIVKYESNSYNDAEFWIATRTEEKSKVTGTQPKLSINKKLRSANQNHLSKSNNNSWKPVPRTIKRPAQLEIKEELDGKRLKLDECAHSSNAVVNGVQESRNSVAPSKDTINDNQETHTDDFSNELNSLKNPALLSRLMNGGRRLVPIQRPVEITIQPMDACSNACQPDKCMTDETLSPYHAATSDSDAAMDEEVTSDHEMSPYEAPAETTNNVYGTANDPGHSSADRPTAAQNSTARSRHRNPRLITEQQMYDHLTSFLRQMGSALRHRTEMYNTSRSSPEPDVLQPSEERHTTITASSSSSNQDQHSNDVANKTPTKKHKKLFQFVLPPEYDAYDSRWTLNYPIWQPGLVKLVPESHVYVNYEDLNFCRQVSEDCPSLARRLLTEVFNRDALSVCSSMMETAKASNSVGSNIRPDLDDHACSTLLNFVIEHGRQRGWNTDLKPILSMLHSKTEEIRFEFGGYDY